jgi:hypothetical protein
MTLWVKIRLLPGYRYVSSRRLRTCPGVDLPPLCANAQKRL